MASPSPVVFVPLYSQEAARSTPRRRQPSPFSHDSYSPITVTSSEKNKSKSAYPVITNFEEAEQAISHLRTQIEEEKRANDSLKVLVAKGPGAIAERCRFHEDRADKAESLVNLRTIQLNSVAESLRSTIEEYENFKEEAESVVQESSQKVEFLSQQINYNQIQQEAKQKETNRAMENLMKNSGEMAEFILQQTSTIDRMSLDIKSHRDHLQREKKNAEIQHKTLENTIENLRQDLMNAKTENRNDRDASKKALMEKDEKIMKLVQELRKEEEMTKAEKLAAKLELERNKRQSDDSITSQSREAKELRLKNEEQEAIILRLRMQVKSLQDELSGEQENLNASKRSLNEARQGTEVARSEHEATKNFFEQQKRDWISNREKLDAKIAESTQENEAMKRMIQEKDLSIRELTTRCDKLVDEHHEERSKIKKQAEEEVGSVELHKKSLKEQHDTLQENIKASRNEVRTLSAQLRETRSALVAGGEEQEKAIRKLRAELEENIKEQRIEKTRLQKRVEDENSQLQELEKELTQLRENGEESMSAERKSQLEKAIERHEKSKKDLEQQMNELDALLQQQLNDLGELVQARDAKDEAVAEVSKKLEEARKEQEQERTEFSKTKQQLKEDVETLTLEKKSLSRERDDIEKALERQTQSFEQTSNDLEAVKAALSQKSRDKALKEIQTELESKIHTHEKEREKLETELSAKDKEIQSLQDQVQSISSTREEFEKKFENLKKEYEEKLVDQSHAVAKQQMEEELQKRLQEKEDELEAERKDASTRNLSADSEIRNISKEQREDFQSLLNQLEEIADTLSSIDEEKTSRSPTNIEKEEDSASSSSLFDTRPSFDAIRRNTSTFVREEELLFSKLRVLSKHHNEREEILKQTERSLQSTKHKFHEFRQEIEASKDYKDALTSAELRKQLEKTKEQVRSLIRSHQMSDSPTQQQSQQQPPNSSSGGGEAYMYGASAPRTKRVSSRDGRNTNSKNSNSSAFVDPNYNNSFNQQQPQPRHQEFTSGSVLDVDAMREMSRLKWNVVAETYCPGAPTTEDVWLKKNPDIAERYSGAAHLYHHDHDEYSTSYNNNRGSNNRTTSEDWVKAKHNEAAAGSERMSGSFQGTNPLDRMSSRGVSVDSRTANK